MTLSHMICPRKFNTSRIASTLIFPKSGTVGDTSTLRKRSRENINTKNLADSGRRCLLPRSKQRQQILLGKNRTLTHKVGIMSSRIRIFEYPRYTLGYYQYPTSIPVPDSFVTFVGHGPTRQFCGICEPPIPTSGARVHPYEYLRLRVRFSAQLQQPTRQVLHVQHVSPTSTRGWDMPFWRTRCRYVRAQACTLEKYGYNCTV